MSQGRRRLLAAAAVLLLAGGAYGYVVSAVDGWGYDALEACVDCSNEADRDGRDPTGCVDRFEVPLLVAVPWKAERTEALRPACQRAVDSVALPRAVSIAPDGELRDRLAERLDAPSIDYLGQLGAGPAVLAEGTRITDVNDALRFHLPAALRSRRMAALREAIRHEGDESYRQLDLRRGAWLCLLGDEEEGTALLQRAIEAPPDSIYSREYRDMRLALFACGGPAPHVRDLLASGRARLVHLQLARGDAAPEEVLAAPETELLTLVRRYALARALADGAIEAQRLLEGLRFARARDRARCDASRIVAASPLQTDPELARAAADRLLAFVAEDPTLSSRAAPTYSDEAPEAADTYAREVAADLLVDAALAEASRGDFVGAQRSFERASAIANRTCPLVAVLAGAEVEVASAPGDEDPVRAARQWTQHAFDLELAGRYEDAFEAALHEHRLHPDHPSAWHLAALAPAADRRVPEAWVAAFDDAIHPWLSADAETLRRGRHIVSAGREMWGGLPEQTWRMIVASRAAEGYDVEAFLDHQFYALDGRNALAARYLAARERGDETATQQWREWIEEIAALASTPSRALLLSVAMDDGPREPLEDVPRLMGDR